MGFLFSKNDAHCALLSSFDSKSSFCMKKTYQLKESLRYSRFNRKFLPAFSIYIRFGSQHPSRSNFDSHTKKCKKNYDKSSCLYLSDFCGMERVAMGCFTQEKLWTSVPLRKSSSSFVTLGSLLLQPYSVHVDFSISQVFQFFIQRGQRAQSFCSSCEFQRRKKGIRNPHVHPQTIPKRISAGKIRE